MPKWLRDLSRQFGAWPDISRLPEHLRAWWHGEPTWAEEQFAYMVGTSNGISRGLSRDQAFRLAHEIRPPMNDVVTVARNERDGSVTILQEKRKDASMSDESTEVKRIPIHAGYDRTEGPVGWVELPARLADEATLGGMVIAPGGKANEHGKIVEVMEFGLIPSETFDYRHDSVPVRIGDGAVVGGVRISANMVFQHGRLEDLELVPIVVVDEEHPEEGGEESKVTGYSVVNRTMRVSGALEDNPPGSYIFKVNEEGRVTSVEAIPDRHVVEFRESGYSLEHPYECRAGGKSLHDCAMWQKVQDRKHEFERRSQDGLIGRYYITYDSQDDQLILEEAGGPKQEESPLGEHAREEEGSFLQKLEWGVKMNPETSDPGAVRPAVTRDAAEAAAQGVGALVRRKEGGEWEEVDPCNEPNPGEGSACDLPIGHSGGHSWERSDA